MKTTKINLSAVISVTCSGLAFAQTSGLAGFEAREGYKNATELHLLDSSRWTRSGSISAKAYTYTQGNVLHRDGTQPTDNQMLDVYGGTGDFTYQFNNLDFDVPMANLSNSDIMFSIWYCPGTNSDSAYDSSPFQTLSFLDNAKQEILGLGTGNEVSGQPGELGVWNSLAGSSYTQAGKVTANSHGWNRWDVTFHLSDTAKDQVSVDLIRGYGLSSGVPQQVDAAVSLYNRATLDTNVDSLSALKLGRAGSGSKYYFDDVSISAIPEPSSSALIGLATLAFFARRKRNAA